MWIVEEYLNLSMLLIFVISMFAGIVISLLTYWAYSMFKTANKLDVSEHIQAMLIEENNGQALPKTKTSLWGKWCNYWYKLYSGAGVERYYNNKQKAGTETLVIPLIVFIIIFLFSGQNIIISTMGMPIPLIILSLVLKKKHDLAIKKLNDQLPGFLFALKANVQAAKTPEQALISATESMPSPLYEEISGVKSSLLAGQSFEESLEALAGKTKLRELEDLARYMIISNNSGSSLEQSLDTIQNILKRKREIAEEKNRAISATRPDLWASVLTIPIMFLFTWIYDPVGRAFWFVKPMSIPVILVVVFFYGIGVYLSRRAVRVLEDKQR